MDTSLNAEVKAKIEFHFKKVMELLGLDVENDDSLQGTPERLAKMYVDELFYGLDKNKFPRMMTVKNKDAEGNPMYDGILIERDIKVKSVCEHHFQPIEGVAHIAYIAKDKLLGLSKFHRVVDYFSRRPQVQERLTTQIYKKLVEVLGTEDVAVIIDAKHYCVIMRGVNDHGSTTVTSRLGGSFKEPAVRQELMDLIRNRSI